MSTHRIFLYDSNLESAQQYRAALEDSHYWVSASSDKKEAEERVRRQFFHLCVWAISDQAEMDAIRALRLERPGMAIVIVSQMSDPAFIVACMRAGASDYWTKSEGVENFPAKAKEVLSRVVLDEPEMEADFPIQKFVGRHPKIQEIFRLIMSVKDTDSTVLITGESGTGKEVVAQSIHDLSPRKRCPWVAVNCGAIPANLLESELFGHVRGAFTGATQNRIGRFQLAGNGTLFLDEISDLTLDLQAKILRAIQQKVYEPVGSAGSLYLNARIIAATNQNLETAVAEKRFREDLFYRLNVIPIVIPPLRERKSDIPLLVKAFLDKFALHHERSITGISEEAMRVLMQYQWPGNIRELENLMERVVILKRDKGIVELKDLPVQHFKSVSLDRYLTNVSLPEGGVDLNDAVNDFENELIIQALQKTNGNRNKAATLLNLNRTTLVEKLKRKNLKIAS